MNVKIGDFLTRIKRPVELDPETEYKQVTIKLHHKGVVLRCLNKGKDIKSKMYEVMAGDFILSGIDARNGAFGIVPEELDGAIVTNDFWYFDVDETVISKQLFLELTQTSWFDEICRLGSDGTTQRIRLQKDRFFNQDIVLPETHKQIELLNKLTDSKRLKKEILKQLTILDKFHSQILKEAFEELK